MNNKSEPEFESDYFEDTEKISQADYSDPNAEKNIHETNSIFRLITENMQDIIVQLDINGIRQYVSPSYKNILGYEPEQLLGGSGFELIHPDDMDRIKNLFTEQIKNPSPVRASIRSRHIDGHYLWLEVISNPIFENNSLTGFIIVLRDNTEQKNTEEELKIQSDRLELVSQNLGAGLAIISKDYKTIWANSVLKKLYGDDIEGQICYSTYNKRNSICPDCGVHEIFTTDKEMVVHEQKGVDVNGNVTWGEIIATPVKDKDGNITSALELVVDITERKKMEEELLKMKKIEAIGTFAGAIAHEFNNILTYILGNISFARMFANTEDKDEIVNVLNNAEQSALDAKKLTKQLLSFAKGAPTVIKRGSVTKLLKESISYILHGSNIRCEFFIPSDLWEVEMDEGQINKVIQNLLINSKEIMKDNGTIWISAKNIELGQKNNFSLDAGKYVKVFIKDQGPGIPQEHLAKIFDPYFTTKPKASGLGLAIAYSIIRKHRGLITVESDMGEGATFTFFLPAFPEAEEDN